MSDWTNDQILNEKDVGNIRKVMCLLRVAWVAQLVLLAAMVVIAHVIRPKMIESGKVGDKTVLTVVNISFVIVGAISLVIAYYLRRSRIRTGLRGFTTITMPNMPPYLAGYAEAVFAASSIAAAVGICGFVPFIMGAGPEILYGFAAVGAAAMIYMRPKKTELIALCQTKKADTAQQNTKPEA